MTEAQAIAAELSPIEDIVGQGKAVGDWLRASILQVLHQESYSVSELCKLFDVPQPALSHHLKILLQAGLVARRREGNSIFYRRASLAADSVGAALLSGLDRAELDRNLHQRINTIHQTRNQRSADFFARNAAEISAEQAQISEPGTYVDSVLEMLVEATDEGAAIHEVLEVGPGGGEMLTQLAALFDGVTGVDTSASMLDAAKKATVDWPGVRLLHQDFLTLQANAPSDAPPFDAPPFDAIVAAMVVHHQASPASFFQQAARLLPGAGALVVAELCRHDQQWANEACGDQWLGFEPADLSGWAERADLELMQSQYLAQKNGFRIQIHRYRKRDQAASTRALST